MKAIKLLLTMCLFFAITTSCEKESIQETEVIQQIDDASKTFYLDVDGFIFKIPRSGFGQQSKVDVMCTDSIGGTFYALLDYGGGNYVLMDSDGGYQSIGYENAMNHLGWMGC